MTNKLKNLAKTAFAAAAVTISGGQTNASAQQSNTIGHEIQYQQNNEPRYSFNDNDCMDLAISTIKNSERSDSELKSFRLEYIKNIDKFYSESQGYYNLSMNNFLDVLTQCGCSKTEILKGKKAFMQKSLEQENLFSNTLQPQIEKSSHRSFDTPIYAVDGGKIAYYVDGGKLNISGTYEGSINHLLPATYRLSDGQYQCGSSIGDDKNFTETEEKLQINVLVRDHQVYKDISKRINNGENVSQAELNFVKSHPQELKESGLSFDAKGNLKQQNPRVKISNTMDRTSHNR